MFPLAAATIILLTTFCILLPPQLTIATGPPLCDARFGTPGIADCNKLLKGLRLRDSRLHYYRTPTSDEGGTPPKWATFCTWYKYAVNLPIFLKSTSCNIVIFSICGPDGAASSDIGSYFDIAQSGTALLTSCLKNDIPARPPASGFGGFGQAGNHDLIRIMVYAPGSFIDYEIKSHQIYDSLVIADEMRRPATFPTGTTAVKLHCAATTTMTTTMALPASATKATLRPGAGLISCDSSEPNWDALEDLVDLEEMDIDSAYW